MILGEDDDDFEPGMRTSPEQVAATGHQGLVVLSNVLLLPLAAVMWHFLGWQVGLGIPLAVWALAALSDLGIVKAGGSLALADNVRVVLLVLGWMAPMLALLWVRG